MRSRVVEILSEAELAERYLHVKQLRRMLKQAEMLRAREPRTVTDSLSAGSDQTIDVSGNRRAFCRP